MSIPKATTQQPALELDPIEHHDGQAQVVQPPAHEFDQVLARARDELARHRRLAGRTRDLVDLGALRPQVVGEEPGVSGRQTAKKAIVAIAVEVREPRGFGRARLRCVPDVSAASLVPFVCDVVEPGAVVRCASIQAAQSDE